MTNKPHRNAIWDEEKEAWRLGNLWYMPDKCYLGQWAWYNWDTNEIVAECLDPDAEVEVMIV